MEHDTALIGGKAPKTAPEKVQSKKFLSGVEGFSISGIYIYRGVKIFPDQSTERRLLDDRQDGNPGAGVAAAVLWIRLKRRLTNRTEGTEKGKD